MRAYLAVRNREAELTDELERAGARINEQVGRLLVTSGGPKSAAWASNVWLAAERIEFGSIAQAASALLARQRRWALWSERHHRRATLISERLPAESVRALHFGERPARGALGSWTLLDEGVLLASSRCSSPFAHGEVAFVEDRRAPPSRAYLKLWELFTLTGRAPRPGELCLDLGSSPGGWSWVLSTLGASVISVDKAPLHPSVARCDNVRFLQKSAFGIDPRQHPPVDWLFSDVICYPARLLEYVQRWIASGKVKNLVCTLKFQGDTDLDAARAFAAIPGSRLLHLHHNRHELTWWRLM